MKPSSIFSVLYEDDFLVAINKPPRVASVPAPHIPRGESVLGKMERQFAEKNTRPYLLHRLDRDTSGVLLFGKFPRDRELLEKIFGDSETAKTYILLATGVPQGSSIRAKLKSRTSGELIPAETTFRVVERFKLPPYTFSLTEAKIKTGRKHQIRQHFAKIGHPIIGDDEYGDVKLNKKFRHAFHLGRHFLHAASLVFHHPLLKKQIRIEAPLPPDLQSILKKLRSFQ